MKTLHLLFSVVTLGCVFLLTGCGDDQRTSPPPPQSPSQAESKNNKPIIRVSEYEAERLRSENEKLRRQLEAGTKPTVTKPAPRVAVEPRPAPAKTPLPQNINQENELLRKQIEEVQNRMVQEYEEHKTAEKNAKIRQENEALRRRLNALEEELHAAKVKRDHIHAPPARPKQSPPSHVTTSQPPTIPSVSYFYEPLSHHGTWIKSVDYGFVFSPRDGRSQGWHPYGTGRWANTDFGWTWASNEDHGWATCHYGRWTQHPALGWLWVPGTVWAPAWVSWRVGNQVAGWAPLPPESAKQALFGPDVEQRYRIPAERYLFLPLQQLSTGSYGSHYLGLSQYQQCFRSTNNVTQIEQMNQHSVYHHGLSRFGFLPIKTPNYDVSFCQHKAGESDHCGTTVPRSNSGALVLNVMDPRAPVLKTPTSATRLQSTLFNPKDTRPLPAPPVKKSTRPAPPIVYGPPTPKQVKEIKVEDVAKQLLQGWLEKKINDRQRR